MKFSIQVGNLISAVERVAATVDKKGTEDGTSCILVKAVQGETMSAVYFYSTIYKAETVFKCEATVEDPGTALFDLDQLQAGLLHRNPEDIAQLTLIEDPDKPVRVCCRIGTSVFHLAYSDRGKDLLAARMDEIPFQQEASFTMQGKNLAEFVRRVSFCIPRENEGTRNFELTGMRLLTTERGYEAQATDGHVCARVIIKGEAGEAAVPSVLIPYLALPSLSKLVKKEETVKIIEGARNGRNELDKLFFRIGETTFFGTRLLSGAFPVIDSVLAMHAPDFWFTVDRTLLRQNLERAISFDDLRLLKIRIVGHEMLLSAKGKIADSYDELPIELEEGVPDDLDLSLTINIDYLKNVASGSTQKRLRLGLGDTRLKAKAGRALVVDDTYADVSALYAIMPVKEAA